MKELNKILNQINPILATILTAYQLYETYQKLSQENQKHYF